MAKNQDIRNKAKKHKLVFNILLYSSLLLIMILVPYSQKTDFAGQATSLTEFQCNNGLDDDGDGNIDCADTDCSGYVSAIAVDGKIQATAICANNNANICNNDNEGMVVNTGKFDALCNSKKWSESNPNGDKEGTGYISSVIAEGVFINTFSADSNNCSYIAAKYPIINPQYESWIGCGCNKGPDGVQASEGDVYAGRTCKNKKWVECTQDSECKSDQICNLQWNSCVYAPKCTDSDYGIKSMKKGTISLNGAATIFTDYCTTNNESAEKVNFAAAYLVEYYCKEDKVEPTILKCPANQECLDGACIPTCKNNLDCKESEYCDNSSAICREKCFDTDNDDGNHLNYKVKGTVTGGKFLQEKQSVEDHCVDKNGKSVAIGDFLVEYTCTLDKTKYIQFTPYACQCANGECIAEMQIITPEQQPPVNNSIINETKINETKLDNNSLQQPQNSSATNATINTNTTNAPVIPPTTGSSSSSDNEKKSSKQSCIPEYNDKICLDGLDAEPCIGGEKEYFCPPVNNCDKKKLVVEFCSQTISITNPEFVNHCFNKKKDSDETEVDCGGNDCKKCSSFITQGIDKLNNPVSPAQSTSFNNETPVEQSSIVEYVLYGLTVLILLLLLVFYIIIKKRRQNLQG